MMESRVTTIKGGRVLRPRSGHAEYADVLARDREIIAIGPDPPVPDRAETIDASGLLLHPG
jgi:dihydroorotase-like cyclic amidohydrolase